jgi:cell division protein FtsZ
MSMAAQNEKRKAHLKAFNYQFKHQMQKVDDMEREPAYKRQGVALESEAPETSSRLTLDVDQNEEIQLRSNNSFLHDNVD